LPVCTHRWRERARAHEVLELWLLHVATGLTMKNVAFGLLPAAKRAP
jgi:hypothetical protein